MSRTISDSLASRIEHFWHAIDSIEHTPESSIAFFELYRDPRSRLIRAMNEGEKSFRNSVCARWARFDLRGQTGYFEPEWHVLLEEFWTDIAADYRAVSSTYPRDNVLLNQLIARGHLTLPDVKTIEGAIPDLVVNAFEFPEPGIIFRTLFYDKSATRGGIESEHYKILKWYVRKHLQHVRISPEAADGVEYHLMEQSRFVHPDKGRPGKVATSRPAGRELLAWLCLASYENSDPLLRPYLSFYADLINVPLLDLIATRAANLGMEHDNRDGRKLPRTRLEEIYQKFNTWLPDWIAGAKQLIDSQR